MKRMIQPAVIVLLGVVAGSFLGCSSAGHPARLAANQSLRPATLSAPSMIAPARVPASTLVHLDSDYQFTNLISQSSQPVLVDFYAEWCGPCKKQGQVLQELAASGSGTQATIVKVNIDDHAKLAEQFQVTGLPTLVVFKDGQPVARKTGFSTSQQVASLLGN